jgi:small subunit ribosomal protein S6
MAEQTPTYDLVLLLSMTVEDERRAKILADVEAAIAGGDGSIVHNADWGKRPLAYQIDHQPEAEYHLLQFTGPPSLLESLNHTLGITDGVVRFRIIKVLPGTPAPPSPDRIAVPATPPAPASAAPAAAAESAAAVTESPAPGPAPAAVAEAEPSPEPEPVVPEGDDEPAE